MSISDLIQPRHLARRAVVYVRQSSPNQVMNNRESQELQYALVQRACELGWHEHDIQVVDIDLGVTGRTARGRSGYQQLVAQVALNEIGILIAYEAQRLGRNCTHWYQLLDLCGHADCLIADRDGVYDASSINGNKYPAYISWQTFERIQQMLSDHYSDYDRNKTRGVPREGKALLQGIVYCGQFSHKMTLQYSGGVRYICNHLQMQHGEPLCQRLLADSIDEKVVQWFFEALSVAEIDLSASALEEADSRRDELLSARRKEVERLRYQSRLAERQYHHTDPENRLVAAELEQRWETTLRELQKAEERLMHEEQNMPCWAIPPDLLDALREVGPRLPELWEQGLFGPSQKKALLRCLVDKV